MEEFSEELRAYVDGADFACGKSVNLGATFGRPVLQALPPDLLPDETICGRVNDTV